MTAIETKMPSRIPQPAFLHALPLARTAMRTRTAPIPAKPSLPSTSRLRPPYYACSDAADLHDSWRVYTKPGNNCVICGGQGATKCLYCFGEGSVRVGPEVERDTVTCPHCEGRGKESCIRCDGSGIRPDTRFDGDGAVVRNLTNEEVCSLPLDEYDTGQVESTERETERETASNGVAS